MTEIGKTIMLHRESNKIAIIDSEDLPDHFKCAVGSLKNVLVKKKSCIECEDLNVDYECVAIQKEIKTDVPFERLKELPIECDFSKHNVYVTVKKYIEEMPVVKTSKTSVFFKTTDGKIKYTNFRNIKKILNYNPGQEMPIKILKKRGRKPFKNPSDVNPNPACQTKKSTKSNQPTIKKKRGRKVTGWIPVPAPKGKKEYINEVPQEIDYRGVQDVYLDLPDGREGMHIMRSSGGRVFWKDPKTGQYSATALKKVNSDEIKVYTIITK